MTCLTLLFVGGMAAALLLLVLSWLAGSSGAWQVCLISSWMSGFLIATVTDLRDRYRKKE
jgi:hypothetical protein